MFLKKTSFGSCKMKWREVQECGRALRWKHLPSHMWQPYSEAERGLPFVQAHSVPLKHMLTATLSWEYQDSGKAAGTCLQVHFTLIHYSQPLLFLPKYFKATNLLIMAATLGDERSLCAWSPTSWAERLRPESSASLSTQPPVTELDVWKEPELPKANQMP